MARPTKGSPEAKAWAEKMRVARKTKTPQTNTQVETNQVETNQPARNVPDISQDEDIRALKRRIEELEAKQFFQPQNQPIVTNTGVIGAKDRYIVDPIHYPSPVEQLTKEPKLQRFAFDRNYELTWDVSSVEYPNINGIRMREPKFKIELHKVVFDETTGEPTAGRYVIMKGTFFEDPQAALIVARDNGVEVDESREKDFLDEMRYMRIRDWLIEAFYPPRVNPAQQRKEMVLNGRIVPYFEVNSEEPASIPFDQLKTKI